MLYRYSASDKSGKIIEAELEADTMAGALQYLSTKELQLVTIKPLTTGRSFFGGIFRGITLTDKVFLTRYLSLMLRAGTDLLSAINILIADFDRPAMRDFLIEIRENVSRGRPFYQAFAEHPKVFSSVFINLVKASEGSGNLQQIFEDLSISLQREAELKARIRSALIYPIILLVMSFVIIGFLVTFALPRIATAFLETGIKPPVFSRIVFGFSLFLGDHIVLLTLILLAIVGPGTYFFWKNSVGQRMASRFLTHLPLIRKIYKDLAIQRFASTFSVLMKAGLPIMQTTRVTAEVVGSEEFRVSLLRIVEGGLAKGLTIGEAFRHESVFPKIVTNLIAVSEKAGHLEEILGTLADFYQSSVEANIKSLVAVLEPALLLVMGSLVAIVALAIIVPVYQLTAQF